MTLGKGLGELMTNLNLASQFQFDNFLHCYARPRSRAVQHTLQESTQREAICAQNCYKVKATKFKASKFEQFIL